MVLQFCSSNTVESFPQENKRKEERKKTSDAHVLSSVGGPRLRWSMPTNANFVGQRDLRPADSVKHLWTVAKRPIDNKWQEIIKCENQPPIREQRQPLKKYRTRGVRFSVQDAIVAERGKKNHNHREVLTSKESA